MLMRLGVGLVTTPPPGLASSSQPGIVGCELFPNVTKPELTGGFVRSRCCCCEAAAGLPPETTDGAHPTLPLSTCCFVASAPAPADASDVFG